jgi:hypothetical protein
MCESACFCSGEVEGSSGQMLSSDCDCGAKVAQKRAGGMT